jgi:ribosomal protein S6
MRWYEGLFLFDSGLATKEGEDPATYLKGLLDKHGAKMHSFEKWDDRKLAYEVTKDAQRIRRGTYFLAVYQMEPKAVASFRRDCRLSERVVRDMVVQDDQMLPRIEERIRLKKQREEEAAQAAAEGLPPRRGGRGGGGGRH